MPFFSIVIPVFNRAALLRSTLNSILSQAFTDFEVLLVDDGSTDNTGSLLREWVKEDSRLHTIHQDNAERGKARNNGIQHASGQYVVLFDSDDIMHPDHLLTLHAAIHRLQQPDFIAAKYDFVKDGRHRASDIGKLPEGYYDYRLFLRGNPMACNFTFKNRLPGLYLFEEDRRYSMLEDWMFFLQNLADKRLFLIDQVTVSMTDHEDRSMKNNRQLITRATLALEWMKEHLPFSQQELVQLEAQVMYFSAIHSYLEGERLETLKLLRQATASGGFRTEYVTLFLKAMAGRSLLSKLKR